LREGRFNSEAPLHEDIRKCGTPIAACDFGFPRRHLSAPPVVADPSTVPASGRRFFNGLLRVLLAPSVRDTFVSEQEGR